MAVTEHARLPMRPPASIALRYHLSAASGLPAFWLTVANWFQVRSGAREVCLSLPDPCRLPVVPLGFVPLWASWKTMPS